MVYPPELPKKRPGKADRLGPLPYVIGGISFVPLLGVPFGIVAIIWGLLTGRKGGRSLALMGVGGIAVSVVLYGGLFYFGFVQRDGIYDELRTSMAQLSLNSLVKHIEFYRVTHGEYPDSLQEVVDSVLENGLDIVMVQDPRQMPWQNEPGLFYYRKADNAHYYLRAVGPDGDPWSEGSLGPQVETGQGTLGLLAGPPETQ